MMGASVTYQFNLIFTNRLWQKAEYMALLFLATCLMAAPVLMTVYQGVMVAPGNEITMGSGKLVFWLALAGSILVTERRERPRTFSAGMDSAGSEAALQSPYPYLLMA